MFDSPSHAQRSCFLGEVKVADTISCVSSNKFPLQSPQSNNPSLCWTNPPAAAAEAVGSLAMRIAYHS